MFFLSSVQRNDIQRGPCAVICSSSLWRRKEEEKERGHPEKESRGKNSGQRTPGVFFGQSRRKWGSNDDFVSLLLWKRKVSTHTQMLHTEWKMQFVPQEVVGWHALCRARPKFHGSCTRTLEGIDTAHGGTEGALFSIKFATGWTSVKGHHEDLPECDLCLRYCPTCGDCPLYFAPSHQVRQGKPGLCVEKMSRMVFHGWEGNYSGPQVEFMWHQCLFLLADVVVSVLIGGNQITPHLAMEGCLMILDQSYSSWFHLNLLRVVGTR